MLRKITALMLAVMFSLIPGITLLHAAELNDVCGHDVNNYIITLGGTASYEYLYDDIWCANVTYPDSSGECPKCDHIWYGTYVKLVKHDYVNRPECSRCLMTHPDYQS